MQFHLDPVSLKVQTSESSDSRDHLLGIAALLEAL